MSDINEDLLNKIQQLTEENKVLKEEVLFWHFFYSESIRLFGDKKEELAPMLKKIMRLIKDVCRAQAKSELDGKSNIRT